MVTSMVASAVTSWTTPSISAGMIVGKIPTTWRNACWIAERKAGRLSTTCETSVGRI